MKKKGLKILFLSLLLLPLQPVQACITCDKRISEGIFDSAFGARALYMLLPFGLLAGIVAVLAAVGTRKHKHNLSNNSKALSPVPLTAVATIIGIGIGGFIDGIVLHQLLQWHEMISAQLPPVDYVSKSINMFWDGIFHAACLLVVLTGVVLLWKLMHRTGIDRRGNLLVGGLITGWGLFNLVEGILDHQLLQLHNVRERIPNVQSWNIGFLIFSVLLLVVGFWISRQKRNLPPTTV